MPSSATDVQLLLIRVGCSPPQTLVHFVLSDRHISLDANFTPEQWLSCATACEQRNSFQVTDSSYCPTTIESLDGVVVRVLKKCVPQLVCSSQACIYAFAYAARQ